MYSKYFIFSLFIVILAACGGAKDGTNPEGGIYTNTAVRYYVDSVEYEFYKKNATTSPQIGDYLTLHFAIQNEKGDTVASSYRLGRPIDTKILAPRSKNDPMTVLKHTTAGDSLALWVDAKASFALSGRPLADTIPLGSKLKYSYWIFSVKAYAHKLQERRQEEDQLIRRYFQEKKKDLNKIYHDPSLGLYWEETFDGGWIGVRKPIMGDSVVINYRTWDIHDNLIDESANGKYIPLKIGGQRLLPAWEFALVNLLEVNKEYRLYVPSHLGFGDTERIITNYNTRTEVKLLPFSILICDIKLMGIVPRKQ